jgi:hypothetical protein
MSLGLRDGLEPRRENCFVALYNSLNPFKEEFIRKMRELMLAGANYRQKSTTIPFSLALEEKPNVCQMLPPHRKRVIRQFERP